MPPHQVGVLLHCGLVARAERQASSSSLSSGFGWLSSLYLPALLLHHVLLPASLQVLLMLLLLPPSLLPPLLLLLVLLTWRPSSLLLMLQQEWLVDSRILYAESLSTFSSFLSAFGWAGDECSLGPFLLLLLL